MSENYKFKVGDRVQFKSWEEMEDDRGDIMPIAFIKGMRYLCNTFATISKIYLDEYTCELKDFSAQGDTDWSYSLDMLKLVEEAEAEPREGVKVLENLEKYFLENFLDTDVVTVRSIIDVINEYKQGIKQDGEVKE